MAAMVDRPLSAMSTAAIDPIVAQQRRGRESIEVIDVDLLDDNVPNASRHASAQPAVPSPPPTTTTTARPLSRRRHITMGVIEPETILVLDSDEEEPIAGTSNGRQARSRLFSPPPQAHRPSPVPPVPPVPSRYSSHTSLPMRPPVRAIARPFDFEANHRARHSTPTNVNLRQRIGSPHPRAAVPSHHVPSMGLGGALISSYRESQHQNAHHHHHQHQHHHPQPGLLARAGAAASGFANRLSRNLAQYRNWGSGDIGPTAHFDGNDEHQRHHRDYHHNHLPPHTRDDDALARLLVETEMQELFGRHLLRHFVRDQQPQGVIYQPAYTHPRPPEPGFTHDFGAEPTPTSPHRRRQSGPIVIDDDEMEVGPSSASTTSASSQRRALSPASIKSSNVLVCARCLEPLVLSAGLVGEDAERRRVWALRCGHMIDGKCLKVISQPSGDVSDEEGAIQMEVKRRGKARASSAKAIGKGKGKAKAVDDEHEAESKIPEYGATLASSPPSNYGDNSIRSRLRSSRTSTALSIPVSPPTSLAATRRRRSRKPKVEGEYRYLCPVVGCGYIHVSVKLNGEWRPERDEDRKKQGGRRSVKFPNDIFADDEGGIDVRGRGAIQVFV